MLDAVRCRVHVFPRLSVRQWVLAAPKAAALLPADPSGRCLACVPARGGATPARALHYPGSGPSARVGAIAFIHRFGSTLNAHLHFHCLVIEGVFESAAAAGVIFRAATGLDENAIAEVQLRHRLLRTFVRRVLPRGQRRARHRAVWCGGCFSVDRVYVRFCDRAGITLQVRAFSVSRSMGLVSENVADFGSSKRPQHYILASTTNRRT